MRRDAARSIVSLLTGVVFGLGLAISDMTDPSKIIAFLNVLGDWDPSLLLVMGSAVTVTWIGYRVSPGTTPILDNDFHLPTATLLDRQLIVGAAIFGLGWGLAGYCPGPAIASLGSAKPYVYLFVVTLFIGGYLSDLFVDRAATKG